MQATLVQVMPDDHSKSVPPLPIPNRTVKRLCADDSAATSVKVGYRQASYKRKPVSICWRAFSLFMPGYCMPARRVSSRSRRARSSDLAWRAKRATCARLQEFAIIRLPLRGVTKSSTKSSSCADVDAPKNVARKKRS